MALDTLDPHRERGRELLRRGRLMLLFTPGLVPGVEAAPGEESPAEVRRALDALDACVAHVDALQLRVKRPLSGRAPGAGLAESSDARALHAWAGRILDLLAARPGHALPLLVNDRVDVAAWLATEIARRGLEDLVPGVHLGQDDLPPAEARALVGPGALVGRSTHDFAQVVRAGEEPVDYLGFGPIYPTATKGYERGVGSERAWLADQATSLPVWPIGGIDPANAGALAPVGRAAVSSAVLGADDPGLAATRLRAALGAG